ncbi:MAG: hypothetical protein MUP71_04530 [Candidatus Aminicenantes bacterium]|nr:hypothetical protein [Candidatus Aminicenantes bacterium]
MAKSFRTLFSLTMIALVFLPAALRAAEKAADPCSLLTQAEIQAILGETVKAGTPKINANPLAGADCTYVVNDFGSFNVLVKPLQTGETPERIKAMFAKMKMKPVDLPGVGDASFFTSPGFDMVQLHTFKASKYILFTLMDPKRKEDAARPLAAKLMEKLLPRL